MRNREERFGTSSLRIEEKIKLLEKENSNLKLEKDFNRIYDEEMLDLHDIKIKEQMSEIHSLSKKLQARVFSRGAQIKNYPAGFILYFVL